MGLAMTVTSGLELLLPTTRHTAAGAMRNYYLQSKDLKILTMGKRVCGKKGREMGTLKRCGGKRKGEREKRSQSPVKRRTFVLHRRRSTGRAADLAFSPSIESRNTALRRRAGRGDLRLSPRLVVVVGIHTHHRRSRITIANHLIATERFLEDGSPRLL